MSVLRSIEGSIERVFEGVFGRAFRTHVQPVELARKLAKEMDEHRSVSVSRVYVPNEYTVYLSPADRQQFVSYEGSLVGELQEYLTEHARRESYALLTPPRVAFLVDDDLAVGEFGIAARVAQPEDGLPSLPEEAPPARVSIPAPPVPVPPVPAPVPAPPEAARAPAPTTTMVYPPRDWSDLTPTEVKEPEPVREVVTLTLAGKAHPITSARFVIGRSRECDLTVTDGNASRRHAEILREEDSYVVVDLGSTNGTELNGRRITREELNDGDRITLGATDVVFGRSRS
jgi:FhaA, N-terminal domain/FHA domain